MKTLSAFMVCLLVSLASFGSAWAENIKGDFQLLLQGRTCKNCIGQISQGYLSKLTHPTEGVWRLEPRDLVTFHAGQYSIGENYKVNPDYVYRK